MKAAIPVPTRLDRDLKLFLSNVKERVDLLEKSTTGTTILSTQTPSSSVVKSNGKSLYSVTIADSSETSFSIPVGFSWYEIQVLGISTSIDNAFVRMQVSKDGGVSYVTSYVNANGGVNQAGTFSGAGSGASSFVHLQPTDYGMGTLSQSELFVEFTNPFQVGENKSIISRGNITRDVNSSATVFGSTRVGSDQFNNVKFSVSSGNFKNATITLYGYN